MIPTSYKVNSYEEIPEFSAQEVYQMIQNGKKFALYDELVIDLTELNHPGGIQIMSPFINNFQSSIKDSFTKYEHSRYADVLICLNTIGRIKSSTKQNVVKKSDVLQGKKLFETVSRYNEFKLHQQTLQKIDFSKPIYNQLNQLSIEEKRCLISIPTKLEDNGKVKFKANPIEQLIYTNNFWRSTICFQIFIFLGFIYLVMKSLEGNSFLNFLPYILFGVIKWTLIEYYFHRYQLHYELSAKPLIGNHLMHHVFPNMKNKLSLSIFQVLTYMVGFYLMYFLFLQKSEIISILLGILIGLTLYDIAHYYFHFGSEINIPILINLKRNHLKHHYRDLNKGFGVSNTIWDKLLGSQHKI